MGTKLKHGIKKLLSFSMVTVLVVSLFSGFTPQATAEAASYSYNTSVRDDYNTSLSSQALAYYSGNYSFSSLSSLSGTELFSKLHELMKGTLTYQCTYSELPSYWKYTDSEAGQEIATYFYSDVPSTSFGTLNREHVWPKSNGSFYQKGAGCDIHHLRPADSVANSNRGSYVMGNVNNRESSKSYASNGSTLCGYQSGQTFEPLDNVKGDVARIFLYVYCTWQQPNMFESLGGSQLPPKDNDDSTNGGSKVIESLATLLQWCYEDPVDAWEMSRNDITESIQGNRNVFIDYPELAWQIFGLTAPSDMVSPSSSNVYDASATFDRSSVVNYATPSMGNYDGKISAKQIEAERYKVTDGDYVILNTEIGKAISSNAVGTYYRAGVDYTIGQSASDDIIWNLKRNADGTFYITHNGNKLAVDSSKKNLLLDSDATGTVHAKWKLLSDGNGNFYFEDSQKEGHYIYWGASYSDFSTEEYSGNLGVFSFKLVKVSDGQAVVGSKLEDGDIGKIEEKVRENVTLADGKYILYNNANKVAISTGISLTYYRSGLSVKLNADNSVTNPSKQIVWDVKANGDGTYSITNDGKFLSMTKNNSSTCLYDAEKNVITDTNQAPETSIHSEWIFVKGDKAGTVYVKNVARNACFWWEGGTALRFKAAALDEDNLNIYEMTIATVDGEITEGGGGTVGGDDTDGHIENGTYVVFNPAYGIAMSSQNANEENKFRAGEAFTPAASDNKVAAQLLWTVTNNDDKTITITSQDGKFLSSENTLSMEASASNNTKWTLVDKGNDTFFIKNVGKNTYIEWYAKYNDFSTYSNTSSTELFTMKFIPATLEGGSGEDEKTYTVYFYTEENGELINTQTVKNLSEIKFPEAPKKADVVDEENKTITKFTFKEWTKKVSAEDDTIINYYATYTSKTTEIVEKTIKYVKVTSIDEITDGKYVMVAEDKNNSAFVAMNKSNGSLNKYVRMGGPVEIENDIIKNVGSEIIWTFTKTEDGWTIQDEDNMFLTMKKDNKPFTNVEKVSANSVYSISVNANAEGAFYIKNAPSERNISAYYEQGTNKFMDFRGYVESNASPLYLYKLLEEVDVTFVINGEDYVQTIVKGGTAVPPEGVTPVKESTREGHFTTNYTFEGEWDHALENITEDTTILPLFKEEVVEDPKYTVSFYNDDNTQIGEAQVVYSLDEVKKPENPTKADFTDTENNTITKYTFAEWVKTVAADNEYIVSYTAKFDATTKPISTDNAGKFVKINSLAELTDGKYIFITYVADKAYAMSNVKANANAKKPVVVTVENDAVATEEASIIWQLTKQEDGTYTFAGADGKFLAMSIDKNACFGADVKTPDKYCYYSATLNGTEGAIFFNNAEYGRNISAYETGNAVQDFRGYTANQSNIRALYAFKLEEKTYDVPDGTYVIYNANAGMAMSENATGTYYRKGVSFTPVAGTNEADKDLVWTVTNNEDGTITITSNSGKNLSVSTGQKNATLGEANDKWELTKNEDGTFCLKNTVVGTYLQWYSKYSEFSSYTPNSLNENYSMSFVPATVKGEIIDDTHLVADGTYVIYNAGSKMAVSEDGVADKYRAGVEFTPAASDNKADAKLIWTVKNNEGGTITITSNSGKNLSVATTGADLGKENDKWTLTKNEDGTFFVKNVVTLGYLEWYAKYSEFSTFTKIEDESIFKMSFIPATVKGSEGGDDTDDEVVYDAFNKVTSLADITDGKYIIVTPWSNANYAFSKNQAKNAGSRAAVSIEITGNAVKTENTDIIWNLTKTDKGYLLVDETKEYLSMSNAKLPYSSTGSVGDDCYFRILANGTDGAVFIKIKKNVAYNPDSKDYRAYDDNNATLKPIYLYKFIEKTYDVPDGDYVIYNAESEMAMSEVAEATYYRAGVLFTPAAEDNKALATEIWTVKNNDDDTITITSNSGKNLSVTDGKDNATLGEANDKWVTEKQEDGTILVKNVATGKYLTWNATQNYKEFASKASLEAMGAAYAKMSFIPATVCEPDTNEYYYVFEKVDYTADLADGQYILVSSVGNNFWALNNGIGSNKNARAAIEVEAEDGKLITDNANIIWTIKKTADGYTFRDIDGNFLAMTADANACFASNKNYCAPVKDNCVFTLLQNTNDESAFWFKGYKNRAISAYVGGAIVSDFRGYKTDNKSNQPLYLYKLVEKTAKETVTLTADNKTQVYGDNNKALTVSCNLETIPVKFTIARVSGQEVGKYAISITPEKSVKYIVNTVDGIYEITPKTVEVTFNDYSKVYGDADPEMELNFNALVEGDDVKYTTTREAGNNVGTYVISAEVPADVEGFANKNYIFNVSDKLGKFEITKRNLTVEVGTVSKFEGAEDPYFTSGSDDVQYDDDFGFFAYRDNGEEIGEYTIYSGSVAVAEQKEFIKNYNITFVNGVLVIEKDPFKTEPEVIPQVDNGNAGTPATKPAVKPVEPTEKPDEEVTEEPKQDETEIVEEPTPKAEEPAEEPKQEEKTEEKQEETTEEPVVEPEVITIVDNPVPEEVKPEGSSWAGYLFGALGVLVLAGAALFGVKKFKK